MRLRSDFFASALVRDAFAKGGFAVIERKGASEAGAIAIRQIFRDGTETLYLPAPQSFAEEGVQDRIFEARLKAASTEEVARMLEREVRFDSDLWVVVLECEDIDGFFTVVDEEQG
ncbi:DUF1491 family protein [Martelella soudanensis]|uniref:DUF1491 family protein n=1 Tax=unclassified Martelella TaxID=2629616 RepID=UPI0015DEE293|nr:MULTISPECIES: DUF1491 family protein [unclassified Martelella]